MSLPQDVAVSLHGTSDPWSSHSVPQLGWALVVKKGCYRRRLWLGSLEMAALVLGTEHLLALWAELQSPKIYMSQSSTSQYFRM